MTTVRITTTTPGPKGLFDPERRKFLLADKASMTIPELSHKYGASVPTINRELAKARKEAS
ncbi:hypothetical protein [Streptomyces sp. H34-S4]|uniref:hypothetical protein n=1 Tax=Streptomyces sp. H34-S4 TaxID=2996463 RepID=UPI00226FF4B7|nr:hypothetical protein [Streptomyces sp. H34-S4]MCY0937775.1 hypothetical protein [Streptomyces sp. H34-S4]